MLRNRGIRTKLLALLALPVVLLLVAAVAVSALQLRSAAQAAQVERLASGAGAFGVLVSALQAERSVSQAALDHKPVDAELRIARRATDAALLRVRTVLADVHPTSLSAQATAAVAQAVQAHRTLPGLRAAVDSRTRGRDQVGAGYTAAVAADIDLPERIGDGLQDRGIGSRLTVYSAAQRLAELATQQREVGLQALSGGSAPSLPIASALRTLAAEFAGAEAAYRRGASPQQAHALALALTTPRAARAQLSVQQGALAAGSRPTFTSADWRALANPRIDALSALAGPVAADVAAVALERATTARDRAVLVLIAGAALLLLVGGLGVVLARAVTRPLRRLTEAAGELSAELPRMVERMATPGASPRLRLPEIPVTSGDEVGRLAQAFVEVNATTVRVAEEQAALRASITEMFVNVARRNHVLLSRQLAFIDQLERTEEDPDTLDNLFRLDHLATRMRRNAESLIVLAGIDAGRRLRRPMPLSDVVRTAISEIERYDRVDLELRADPPLVGHLALSAAHLLAELLENATQFSGPDTRVVTSAELTADGVRVTVTDLGLGMAPAEIAQANQRIANPPVSEVVGSQQLGLYVVSRLAQRLDAAVQLHAGEGRGTVATVDLPAAVFVPGSVDQLFAGLRDRGVDCGVDCGVDEFVVGSVVEAVTSVVERSVEPVVTSGVQSVEEPVVPSVVTSVVRPAVPSVVPAAPAAGLSPLAALAAGPTVAASQGTGALLDEAAAERLVPVLAQATPLPVSAAAAAVDRWNVDTQPIPVQPVPAQQQAAAPPQPQPEAAAVLDRTTVLDPASESLRETVFEPEPQPEPLLNLAASGLPALDILPTRGGSRGLRRRGKGKARGATAPTVPSAPSASAVLPRHSQAATPTVPELAASPVAAPGALVGTAWAAPATLADTRPVADQAHTGQPSGAQPWSAQPSASQASAPQGSAAQQWGSPSASAPQLGAQLFSAPPSSGPAGDESSRAQSFGGPSTGGEPFGGQPSFGAPLAAAQPSSTATPRTHPVPEPAPSSLFRPAPAAAAVVREIVPAAEVEPSPSVPATPDTTEPVARYAPADQPEPVAPSVAQPDADQPARPVLAPSSLFASAPAPAPVPTFADAPTVVASPPAPIAAPPAAAQTLRERSAMASQALSELSALSSYNPQAGQPAAPAPLPRRGAQGPSAGQLPQQQADEPLGARRSTRNVADVRSMLSGFRAGVEQGPILSPESLSSEEGPAAER